MYSGKPAKGAKLIRCRRDPEESKPVKGFVETSSFLTGRNKGRLWICHPHFLSTGSPTAVEFDWAVVIDREERYGDVMGFYHTHPSGLTKPSRRDIRTMRAWCDCLGKCLLCIIGIPGSDETEVHGYLFHNFRSRGRKVRLTEQKEGQMVFKE